MRWDSTEFSEGRYFFPDSNCIYRRRGKRNGQGQEIPIGSDGKEKKLSSTWLRQPFLFKEDLCGLMFISNLIPYKGD